MPLTIDHPHVRQSPRCPLCHGPKASGLVTCWPCYRSHELKYGNALAETQIDKAEAALSQPFELSAQAETRDEHQPSLFCR